MTVDASKPWRWWLLLAAAFVLPWVAVIGAQGALWTWLPGVVKVNHWRDFSSLCFLAGGVCAVVLLFRTRQHWLARLASSVLALTGAALLALLIQMRSMCGDEAVYIGPRASEQVASCG